MSVTQIKQCWLVDRVFVALFTKNLMIKKSTKLLGTQVAHNILVLWAIFRRINFVRERKTKVFNFMMITVRFLMITGWLQVNFRKFSVTHQIWFCIFTSSLTWVTEVSTGTVMILTVLGTTITFNFSSTYLWYPSSNYWYINYYLLYGY